MSSNNRASLLAGLRTGGVRQPSQMPLTAAPNVTSFPRAEFPMTASIGGSFNQIIPPQAHAHSQAQAQAQQQAFQMQMMQMEILRLQVRVLPVPLFLIGRHHQPLFHVLSDHQTLTWINSHLLHSCLQAIQQAQQQYQLELTRQQQQIQHQQQTVPNRRISQQYAEMPHSAAPGITTFAPSRRASQAEQLKSQLHLSSRISQEEHQVPMTASLHGRFGGRLNPNAAAFRMGAFPEEEEMVNNQSPGSNGLTTVISGGTPLGSSNGNGNGATGMSPSKSDTSLNWRRGGNNNSVLSGNRTASVSVRITPPPGERNISPLGHLKSHRPEPLRFSVLHEAPSTPLVIVDNSDGEDGDDSSSTSSSKSEPTTPPSGGISDVPLSPREIASKRLYEGLGIGRPIPQSAAVHTLSFTGSKVPPQTSVGLMFANTNRIVSQPSRQPRGPPSGDELGTKNFASRIRRKAIGGLGAMLDARVNRQEIEAF